MSPCHRLLTAFPRTNPVRFTYLACSNKIFPVCGSIAQECGSISHGLWINCACGSIAQEDCRPVYLAAINGNTAVVKVLLEAGADVESEDKVPHTRTCFLFLSHTHIVEADGYGGEVRVSCKCEGRTRGRWFGQFRQVVAVLRCSITLQPLQGFCRSGVPSNRTARVPDFAMPKPES